MVSFQGAVLADKRGAATFEFLKVSPGNSRTVAMYVAITAAFTVQNVLATFEGVTTQVTGSGSLLCLRHLLELLASKNTYSGTLASIKFFEAFCGICAFFNSIMIVHTTYPDSKFWKQR